MMSKMVREKAREQVREQVRGVASTPKNWKLIERKPRDRQKDDEMYSRSEEIWKGLPRGHFRIYDTDVNSSPITELWGLPKFGWEKDVDSLHHKVFPGDVFLGKWYLTKENGSTGHVAYFQDPATLQFYWIIGSKNCHLPLPFDPVLAEPYLKEYEANPGLSYPTQIIKIWLGIWNTLTEAQKTLFLQEMKGKTLCGEAILPEDEHMVLYEETAIYFFAVTQPGDPYQQGLTAMTPDKALQFFKDCGLPIAKDWIFVDYENQSEAEAKKAEDAIIASFRNSPNCEGAVVYSVFRTSDATGNKILVRQIYKEKNTEYMLYRAVREKIRSFGTLSAVMKRIKDITADETRELREDLIEEVEGFFCWMKSLGLPKEELFRILQHKYATWMQTFKAIPVEQRKEIIKNNVDKLPQMVFLVLVGCPGSGKSTLARSLQAFLHAEQTAWVNQDEFAKVNPKKAKQLFEAEITNIIRNNQTANNKHKYVIIDKCLQAREQRDVIRGIVGEEAVIRWIQIGTQSMDDLELYVQRIQSRGENHHTLKAIKSDGNNGNEKFLEGVVRGHLERFQQPNPAKEGGEVIRLDLEAPVQDSMMEVIKSLRLDGFLPDDILQKEADLIQTSIEKSLSYEKSISSSTSTQTSISTQTTRTKPVKWVSVVLDASVYETILQKTGVQRDPKKKNLHMTLAWGEDKSKEILQNELLKEGTSVAIRLGGIAKPSSTSHPNVICIEATPTDEKIHEFLKTLDPTFTGHLTLWVGEGAKPVESKILLQTLKKENRELFTFPEISGMMVSGKVSANFY